jgi:hypothetical protein
MKRKKNLLIVLIVALGVIMACASAPVKEAKEAATFNVEKPTWTVGDTWTYKTETGKFFTWTVDKIKNDFYVVREKGVHLSFPYFTNDLASSHHTNAQDQIFYKNDPPMQYYSWPLQPGKKWHQRIHWEDLKTSNTIDHYSRVVKMETVKVPAGKFETVKVVRTAGDWTYTYWYCPQVKNYVKWITVNPKGTFSQELVEFQVTP